MFQKLIDRIFKPRPRLTILEAQILLAAARHYAGGQNLITDAEVIVNREEV